MDNIKEYVIEHTKNNDVDIYYPCAIYYRGKVSRLTTGGYFTASDALSVIDYHREENEQQCTDNAGHEGGV